MNIGGAINKKRLIQRIFYSILALISLIVIVFVLGIIVYLIVKGGSSLTWEFLTQKPSGGMKEGGISTVIIGTLYLVLGTLVFSLPIGILAAIYLHEYARKNRLTRIIRLSIVNMAGVPSVVFGLFGLGFFVIFLNLGRSVLAGSLTLALLILPTIITTTEEALKSVPDTYRHASLALGASRWQTIVRIVLPQAMPGIITGAVLGVGRAAGETAPILFTAAAF
ncbi:MAG: phosphate ABC transporter permease PstA, partial [Actinomycetia bacterium]|nr:phosphate ABC transporter permease PstA [Actinomycetes bacterium]